MKFSRFSRKIYRQRNKKAIPTFLVIMSDRFPISRGRGLHNNIVLISRITILIGITLVLLGMAHDAVVAPEHLKEFMVLRIGVACTGFCVLAVMASAWGKQRVQILNYCWIMIPQTMLGYMVALTGGFASSYARGFVFVLIAASLFPILNFRQSMVVVTASLAVYLTSSIIGAESSIVYAEAFGASMHIVSLLVIVGIARLFLERTFNALANYEEELKTTLEFVEKKLQELAHHKAVAVHQDKMTSLGNAVAGMLSTINHPVNYALWAVDSTLRGKAVQDSPDLINPLVDVKKALISIQTSMAGLRKFSTPKGMEISHTTVECDFLDMVQSAIKLLGNDLSDIQVVTNVSPGLTVQCDRTAFLTVLMALLNNAKEAVLANKAPDPQILIDAHVIGDRIRVDISDNGIGITSQALPNIFAPFFTTDKSGKKLGLGLSIAYGEIIRHGGTVTAVSAVGEGTTIRFDLPLFGASIEPVQATM